MRTPFVRPFFATFFYWYSAVTTALMVLLSLFLPAFITAIAGPEMGMAVGSIGLLVIPAAIVNGIAGAAIGYCIELLAKIEWNTRPNTDELGYVVPETTPAPSPHAALSGRKYYLREKGQERGPFNGPEVLALYRDGKVSFATMIYVEEDGQRRPLKNLSEINP